MTAQETPQSNSDIKAFFNELNPRLEFARKLDIQMDQKFAHRFNVLDYLNTYEAGLSRIIADLLNPAASHGQGDLFLKHFLKKCQEESEINVSSEWLDFDAKQVKVTTEKQ